jgi:hypothetical protein
MRNKNSKINISFIILYISSAIIVIWISTEIWPSDKRFDNFWFSILYFDFLLALLLLKPILLSCFKQTGGFWLSILSLNIVYIIISFLLLVFINVITVGKGPWLVLIILLWTALYSFVVLIFGKVSQASKETELKDENARIIKDGIINRFSALTLLIRNQFLEGVLFGEVIDNEIEIISKMLDGLSPNYSENVKNEDSNIENQINTIHEDLLNNKCDVLCLEKKLRTLKLSIRKREKLAIKRP